MKLKFDDKGMVVVSEVNGEKLPVFLKDDGSETPIDVRALMSSLSARAEQSTRVEGENKELKKRLGLFSGIDDPDLARKALDTVKNLDMKKLVDAGEVDKVKSEVARVYETQIAELKAELKGMNDQLFNERLGSAFANSKVVREKLTLPSDIVKATFGNQFGVKDGRVYGTDRTGNILYSAVRPGEVADFDEALMMIVNQYEHRDQILKGSGASGSGANGLQGGGSGGKKTITRAEFDKLPAAEQAVAGRTMSVVD